MTAAAESGGLRVELDDGSARTVDHVILGTGFHLDVRRHPLLAPELAAQVSHRNGYPLLRAGYESSVDGLYFIGALSAASFGPIMRFVCGTWFTSAALQHSLGRRRGVAPARATTWRAPDAGLAADARQSAS
jgi:hypothetical protein